MRYLLGLLLLVATQADIAAQEPKTLSDLSPDLMVVAGFDAAKGQLRLSITQYREQEVQKLSVGNGVTLETQKVIGPFRAERYLTLKECKILEVSGKTIAPEDYPKRFKVGAAVVVTTDDKLPAKAFLQVLHPETVIVIGPAVKPDPRIQLPPPPKSPPK